MNREEVIARLKSIQFPMMTDHGCFDTGIEFRILTPERGYFASIGGSWPITGPFQFDRTSFKAAEKLIQLRYKSDPCENGVEDFLEEHEHHSLTCSEIPSMTELDGEGLDILLHMADVKCQSNRNYYMYFDACGSERYFFENLAEAEDFMIADLTSQAEGREWDSMSDDELDEWLQELIYTESNKTDIIAKRYNSD